MKSIWKLSVLFWQPLVGLIIENKKLNKEITYKSNQNKYTEAQAQGINKQNVLL